MPGSTTSTGRDALFAVVAETVFGDGGSTAYAAADDFVDCSGWAVTPQTPGGPRDDATATRRTWATSRARRRSSGP